MSKNTKIIIGAVIIILIGLGIYFAAQRTRQQPQTQTVSSGEQIISSGDIYSAQSNDILKNGNLYASSNTQVQQIIPSPNGTSFIIKLTPGQDSPIGSFAKLEDGKINLLDSGEIFDAAWLDNSRIIYSARKDSSTDIKIKSASGDKKILSVANEDVNLFPADNSLFISYPKDDDTAVVEKVDLANKSAAPVPSGGEALFSVSPDGKSLVTASVNANNSPYKIIDLSDKKIGEVPSNAFADSFKWASAKNLLAITDKDNNQLPSAIISIVIDGKTQTLYESSGKQIADFEIRDSKVVVLFDDSTKTTANLK